MQFDRHTTNYGLKCVEEMSLTTNIESAKKPRPTIPGPAAVDIQVIMSQCYRLPKAVESKIILLLIVDINNDNQIH